MSIKALTSAVRAAVIESDDLRNRPWRGSSNPYAGHCYVASEAVYHALGGRESGITPMNISHEGAPHWWLRLASGEMVDVTAEQFSTPVPYAQGRGRGFLTSHPSQRAAELLRRAASRSPRVPELAPWR